MDQPQQIFTIGFTQKSAEQFFEILAQAGVHRVIDVRLYNNSQLAGYTKSRDLSYFLRSIINVEYMHMPAFAPTKQLLNDYKNGDISWQGYITEYDEILKQRQPYMYLQPDVFESACLLCAEPTADQCHRRLAAEYLQSVWPQMQITHL